MIENLESFDPFTDAGADSVQRMVHVRVQQRTGRTFITTIEGLSENLDLAKLLRHLKRNLCCGGNVREGVMHLTGDQRNKVVDLLIAAEACPPSQIKLHGA